MGICLLMVDNSANTLMCKNIYHSHYDDCAGSECSSGRCNWDWRFHRSLAPLKQIPASDPAPPSDFLLSPFPHCASFILPELGCILNENVAFFINASHEILGQDTLLHPSGFITDLPSSMPYSQNCWKNH